MLSPELAQRGSDIEIRGERGEVLKARISSTPFYDPKHLRQRMEAAA
jgi:glycine cleavage system aminomethyltransferase T